MKIRNKGVYFELREKARLSSVFVFTEKVRKSCNDLSRRDVSKVDGLDALIRKIIDLCMQKIQLAFMAHKKVENFKRPDYINIIN